MTQRIRWGILGTGKIARIFGRALAGSETGRLVAVASRSPERGAAFAHQLTAERGYGTYDAMLRDDTIDVVYIATPHSTHLEWGIKSAESGKHVLCEKPLTVNRKEAADLVDVVQRQDVFLMEAFAYRRHPQTIKLVELLRAGAIGEVCMIEAVFGYDAGPTPGNYILEYDLAGGSILDVGCYAVSMARLVAGATVSRDFADPLEVCGAAHIGESTRVDHYAVASLKFPQGIVASIACGVQVDLGDHLRIVGSEGTIAMSSPWLPGVDGKVTCIVLQRRGAEAEEIEIAPELDLYAMEADTVAAFLQDRQAAAPGMTWQDSLGNMATLDRWRSAVGVVYGTDGGMQAPVGIEGAGVTSALPSR